MNIGFQWIIMAEELILKRNSDKVDSVKNNKRY